MKKFLIAAMFIAFAMSFNTTQAQFNPYASKTKMFTIGVGASGYGIPVFARFEAPVANNVTVGGGVSFQTYSERFNTYKYRSTIFGIHGRGSYHFNELFEFNNDWDLYAGASIGFYSWDTKYDDNGSSITYAGTDRGGVSIGAHVGGRYLINEKVALNAEVGGGTVLSGGTFGVTFMF